MLTMPNDETPSDAQIASQQEALLARADAFEVAGEPDKAQALRDEADSLGSAPADAAPQPSPSE